MIVFENQKAAVNFPKPANRDIFELLTGWVLNLFDKMNKVTFFAFIFALQLILSYQGLDLSDEGFLAIFYEQIFTDPESVTYNFLFWLNGVVGGIWAHFFGGLGIWGLRLFGAIIITATAVVTYSLLERFTTPRVLKLSLFIVTISLLNNDIKVANYNTLSALVFVSLAYFVLEGVFNNKLTFLFIAGMLVCANTFIRIPNILQLGLAGLIAVHHFFAKETLKNSARQIGALVLGFLTAFGLLIWLMHALGHWTVFQESIGYLSKMSDDKNLDENEPGMYGIMYILNEFRLGITKPIIFSAITLVFFFFTQWLINYFEKASRPIALLLKGLYYLAAMAIVYLMVKEVLTPFDHLFVVTGLGIIFFFPIVFTKTSIHKKFLYALGLFFLLSYPMGSSSGIYTAGKFCLWIAVPLAIDYLLGLKSVLLSLSLRSKSQQFAPNFQLQEQGLSKVKAAMIILLIAAGVYNMYTYPFYDWHNRAQMTGTLHSSKLKHIHTTPARAALVNELLDACSQHLRKDEYVISYALIPTIVYATDTKSYLHNSYPQVYKAAIFREDLANSLKRHQFLPTIIRQTKPTTAQASTWPEKNIAEKYDDIPENKASSKVLQEFIENHDYKVVWENSYFQILKTEKKYLTN